MRLSDLDCRNAKPREGKYKMGDSGGLFLEIRPNGGRYFRWRYRFAGKDKTLTIGTYPKVSLAEARRAAQAARDRLDEGVDPGAEKQTDKLTARLVANTTFEGIAREWLKRMRARWVPTHYDRIERRMERDIFPFMGRRPIVEITTPEVLAVLLKIEARGALETAQRAKQNCSQVFCYAVETGRATQDPTALFSSSALSQPEKHNHAAITDADGIAGLVRSIRGYQGSYVVRAALQLAPLVMLRPGELRQAEWGEFDFEGRLDSYGAPMWRIPAARMKMPKEDKAQGGVHMVPLSRQAVAILQDLQKITGGGRYVFPSPRAPRKPLSDNGVLSALRRMGYGKDEMSGHGFRAMARTAIDEQLHIDPRYADMQLAHAVKDGNGRAYNRTKFLRERIDMMQRWADYLDALAEGQDGVTATRQQSDATQVA
ncbi:tyrosine-type recombinase/integrase [Castellaniella sp.]|uniref:tyrosine-type recombinase/integrase n=1 Tax=Castellaniella sp. TaxID=1955812 RepID=UPI002B000A7E|nr:integrase arm-type DNA-binding domain-containing protein [Castellaniella sp.]